MSRTVELMFYGSKLVTRSIHRPYDYLNWMRKLTPRFNGHNYQYPNTYRNFHCIIY